MLVRKRKKYLLMSVISPDFREKEAEIQEDCDMSRVTELVV